MRRPSGEYGVGSAAMADAASAARASSRVVFSGLTRTSSGAADSHARARASRSASPYAAPSLCPQPVGEIGGDRSGQRRGHARLERAQPDGVGRRERAFHLAHADAHFARGHGHREMRRAGRPRELLQRAATAEVGEHAVGDERPVVLTHRGMPAEEFVQQRVGGAPERLHVRDGRGEARELVRARRHCGAFFSSTRIESSTASSVASRTPRKFAVTRIFTGT